MDLVEWRRRTVVAARALRQHSGAVARAYKKLEDTLEPALTPGQTRARLDQLSRDLQALCEKAFQLSLALRESKAIFKVFVPSLQVEIFETDTELVAIDPKPSSSPGIKTLFVVFGGLQKTTLIPGEKQETVLLEKSNVVGFGAN